MSLAIEYDLRTLLYEHLQKLELGFFAGQQTGQLMSRATVDLSSVRFFLGYGLVFILQSGLTIVLGAIAMFWLSPGLAALALIPVPFVVVVATLYGRRSRPALQEVQQRIGEVTAEVEENISGVRVVKAFAAEPRQLDRFRGKVGRVFDQAMFATRLQAFFNPFLAFLPNLGLAVILLVGGRQVINGTLTLGDFTAFYTYLLMLIGPMRMFGVALNLAQRATASGARLLEILDREPGIVSGADAAARRAAGASSCATSRSATATGPDALRDVDLDGRGGLDRRARRRDRLGQDDARPAAPAAVRPALGRRADRRRRRPRRRHRRPAARDRRRRRRPVPVLGHGRRQHRLRAARTPRARRSCSPPSAPRPPGSSTSCPTATTPASASAASPSSGGQRQRIAIARAFLADPRILILDDATSSVDATTEREIKAALREVMEGRTTFVIAHRLSTIALADDIVVLEKGRVVARGTHDELLDESELYAEIATKGLPDQVFLNRDPVERVAGL